MASDIQERRPSATPYVIAFLVLEVFAFFGMSTILVTTLILYKRKRHLVWISFCMGWIIFTLGYCLLLFTGQQFKSKPGFNLCLVQAAHGYGAPSLGSSVTLAFVIHLWLNVMVVIRQKPIPEKKWMEHLANIILVAVPWVMYLTLFIVYLVVGAHHPDLIAKPAAESFCLLSSADRSIYSWTITTPVLAAISAIFVIIVEGIIAYHIGRRRKCTKIIKQLPIGMIARAVFFTMATIGVVVFSFIYASIGKPNAELHIILAITPVLGVFAFGMPKNAFRVRPCGGSRQRKSNTLLQLPTVSITENTTPLSDNLR